MGKYKLEAHHKEHLAAIGIRDVGEHLDCEPHELNAAKALWRVTLPTAPAEVIHTKALGHVAHAKQQFFAGAPIPSAQDAAPVLVEDAKNRELQSLAECLRHIHVTHLPEIANRADELKTGILESHQDLISKIQASHDDLEAIVMAAHGKFSARADKWELAAVNTASSLDAEVTDILHGAKKAFIWLAALLGSILVALVILGFVLYH